MSCPSCAREVDPLRAGHVAIFGDRFYYFCALSCRLLVAPRAATSTSAGQAPEDVLLTPLAFGTGTTGDEALASPSRPAHARRDGSTAAAAPVSASPGPRSVRTRARDVDRAEGSGELGSALLWAALACGILAISLVLAGMTSTVLSLRVAVASLGWVCLVVRALRSPREPTDVHPGFLLAPGFCACAIAVTTWLVRDASTEEAATFAGIVVTEIAVSLQLVERARQAMAGERLRIAEVLSAGANRAAGDQEELILRQDIKPGDELSVAAGEVSSVDGSVVAGEATVVPWFSASEPIKRREGDAILAGARVISGRLRLRATYTGYDRTWARLTLDPRRRADVHARMPRIARMIADRGGLAGLVIGASAAIANGFSSAQVALSAVAAYAAITTAAVGSMAAIHVGRGVLEGLRRGIAYRSPADWDRASDVSIVVFCARGTLLLGEPELAFLEAVGKLSEEQVLALAAGAESASTHPVAMAIQRAAAARRIRADAVRSPIVHPGLGVLAVASTGEQLCVGSRALMLREKISVAIAEQKVAAIEAHGREVLLVAVGGKLVGALGLQDGLRPGARAAVQHLLDAQIEPVLVSGDSRETCEAIGRSLDIEHIRPEVLSNDRAVEIERLGHGGITVAVLGNPRTDEAALSAADVAVAMPAPARVPGEWGVMLASDDVRDGALALSLARRTKNDARVSLLLAVVPGILFALAVAFGLLSPAYAPLLALCGAIASALHARATDLTRAAAPTTTKAFDWARAADVGVHNKVH